MMGGGEGFYSADGSDGLKQDLSGWREVLIPVSAFLKWQKPYYPAITVASTSIIFLYVLILMSYMCGILVKPNTKHFYLKLM